MRKQLSLEEDSSMTTIEGSNGYYEGCQALVLHPKRRHFVEDRFGGCIRGNGSSLTSLGWLLATIFVIGKGAGLYACLIHV